MTLSLIIPCYNEESTLENLVMEVLKIETGEIKLELIIVDDCSKDRSLDVAKRLSREYACIRVCTHEKNKGKGAALRTGFLAANGDYIGIQDADLEYDPVDYREMVRAMVSKNYDVMFGSRYLPHTNRRCLRCWHSRMNRFLTAFSNLMTDLELTDMETCYKLFRRDCIHAIAPHLKENRFGFEPEVVAWVANGFLKKGWCVGETAIDYRPRTFSDGKKIGWKDGVRALYCILKYNLFSRPKF